MVFLSWTVVFGRSLRGSAVVPESGFYYEDACSALAWLGVGFRERVRAWVEVRVWWDS